MPQEVLKIMTSLITSLVHNSQPKEIFNYPGLNQLLNKINF